MKKFFINIFKYLILFFILFFICAYIFSVRNNISFQDTISYFQTVANELILNNNNLQNVNANSSTNNNSTPTNKYNKNYYYQQLDNNAKIIYDGLENNIDKLKKDNYAIDFSTQFNNLLNETNGKYKLNKSFQSALDAFFYDHPELFYLDLSKFSLNMKCISVGSLKTYTVEIVPRNTNYLNSSFKSEKEVKGAINNIENYKNNIVNNFAYQSTYNIILDIHDLLVKTLDYDTTSTASNSHNIYGAFVGNKVVCEGYAKTFKYLMDAFDIECILVSGMATNSSNQTEAHMWNYVKIDDEWYGVDVTWDDPIIVGSYTNNNLRHEYFLKGIYKFKQSHTPNGKITENGMIFTLPTLSNKNYV